MKCTICMAGQVITRAAGGSFLAVMSLLLLLRSNCRADAGGHYAIVQLPFTTNATHPSINNSGEVVWSLQNSNGIISSVRGRLAATGVSPHIAHQTVPECGSPALIDLAWRPRVRRIRAAAPHTALCAARSRGDYAVDCVLESREHAAGARKRTRS